MRITHRLTTTLAMADLLNMHICWWELRKIIQRRMCELHTERSTKATVLIREPPSCTYLAVVMEEESTAGKAPSQRLACECKFVYEKPQVLAELIKYINVCVYSWLYVQQHKTSSSMLLAKQMMTTLKYICPFKTLSPSKQTYLREADTSSSCSTKRHSLLRSN